MTQDQLLYVCLGQATLLIGILIKMLWQGNKSEIVALKEDIKSNSTVTNLNTLAVQKLTVPMESVAEKLDMVGELRRDVDKIGESLRRDRKNH
jgi:hypothetical protein